jgi:hypothetical protein
LRWIGKQGKAAPNTKLVSFVVRDGLSGLLTMKEMANRLTMKEMADPKSRPDEGVTIMAQAFILRSD